MWVLFFLRKFIVFHNSIVTCCASLLLFPHIRKHCFGPYCYDCSLLFLLSLVALPAMSLSLNLLVKYLLPVLALLLALFCTAPSYSKPHQNSCSQHTSSLLCVPVHSFPSDHQKHMRYITTGTVYSFGTLRMTFSAEYLMHPEIGTERCCDSNS